MPALPSYLQGNPAASAQNYLARLPSMFNTAGLQSAYNTQNQVNFDQGRALAAAAANQYTQRARQSGASTLGAGFAQASAMIPVYQQGFQGQGDLQKLLLQYRSQQAQIGAGLTGDIGRLQAGQQSTLSDYYLNQQKLQQQGQQFGQTFGLQQQQLNQQGDQNDATNRLNAIQLASKLPGQSFSWMTNANGGAASSADAAQMQAYQRSLGYQNSIRSGLQSYF